MSSDITHDASEAATTDAHPAEGTRISGPAPPHEVSSFGKSLFLGELHQDLVTPYPQLHSDEQIRVRDLIDEVHAFADDHYDPVEVERNGWVGDDVIRGLGELGVTGLYVPERYGGLGLSQTGYCRVFEALGQIDSSLAVVLGVHQSIGYKGIHLFGTDEQKERFLPDLAAGRKLAGFALTEPNAGSDAYHLETRAERQADGSWVLNGEKRWIGNGNKDVVVVFARSEEHGHIALICTPDMEGFSSPFGYETLGLPGNDLRHLRFDHVRVPPENVLGEPGEGFELAMHVLNNGRMSLGTGSVGAMKKVLGLAVQHVQERQQFGHPLADFELVQEKISWMTSYLYGLESASYLTTGLVDAGVEDYSIESAIMKVAGTEFLWYGVNRAFQLAGGAAYMADSPYAKMLRDVRIFPIFEGSNDVLRAFIALTGLEALGARLEGLGDLDLSTPVRSVGLVVDYVVDRVRREIVPDRLTHVHPGVRDLADRITDQVGRLRETSERLLRTHGRDITGRQWQQKRLAHAVMDIYAQIATLSRVTAVMNDRGAEVTGTQRYLADTFTSRASRRVHRNLDQIADNDDDRMHAIAEVAYQHGGYGFELYG